MGNTSSAPSNRSANATIGGRQYTILNPNGTPTYGGYINEAVVTAATKLVNDTNIAAQVVSVTLGDTAYSVYIGPKPVLQSDGDYGDSGESSRFKNIQKALPTKLPPGKPSDYNWNLPPHQWSLPTTAEVVNASHFKDSKVPAKSRSNDMYRRGRIWWKANAPITITDSKGGSQALSVGEERRKYGFQFIWNPESFGTQVSVQLEATPSVQDRFLGVSGAFPATETISFTLRIDRTNDFACAAAGLRQTSSINRTAAKTVGPLFRSDVEAFYKFYRPKGSFAATVSNADLSDKLIDLYTRGTIADIEYLYKAINGPGPGGALGLDWVNGRGIKTADIGWLMPTLLHVDVGPLSYDGYVTALQVNHLAFTPNMTPIRSDVTISINVLATAALSSSGGTQ